ncbi:MAG: LptF/LptG family permease [Kaiparowitsia implicata GSE-PSE-MK54-09C]|jgi:lipopolysaccharide export system permease protein|nr:LptF/LptG family permease [Kaiparowitsia implicata GSE-PSE-MK54-09C]
MDRYIISELIPPFLFGVGAFTSVGVSIGSLFHLVNQVVERGLPLSIAFEVLLLKMPEFIVYSFPTSVLLAMLMTFSRLSGDSELVALRGCGVSVYRLVAPTIAFCLVVTGLTFMFQEVIMPATNYRASTTLERALGRERPQFRDRDILYQEYGTVTREDGSRENAMSRLFYAKEFDGVEMHGLTILDFSRTGLSQIVSSRAAEWNPGENLWNFRDGTIYVVSEDGSFRNIVKFDEQALQLPRAPIDLARRSRDYNEMNIAQAIERYQVIKNSNNENRIRELRVRIHQKFSLPFICVAFGLVGAALGTQLRRTGRATGFAISILVVFLYYLSAFMSGAIAQAGFVHPLIGAWFPNAFGLSVGLFLLMRSSR